MSTHQPGRARQALRRATAAAHHALDHHPMLQRLTARGLTREHYAESLAAMHQPHARLERLVHQSSHHLASGLKLSARLALLEADILELGRPVPDDVRVATDALEAPAAWWGSVYVLEGSRLGSAVIAGRIRSSLGDAVPCRFLGEARNPEEQGAWLAGLERALDRDDEIEQAVAGAREAFAAYQSGLDDFQSDAVLSSCPQRNASNACNEST